MAKKVSKDLFKKIRQAYNDLEREAPKDVNANINSFINAKYEALKQSGATNIENIGKKENQAAIFALFLFADKIEPKPEAMDNITKTLTDEFEFWTALIQSVKKIFNDSKFKEEELKEISHTGKIVLNTEAYKQEEAQKKSKSNKEVQDFKQKNEQLREKAKKEREINEIENSIKVKKEAEEFYKNIDNEVPKYNPNAKQEKAQPQKEVKELPLKEVVTETNIELYLTFAKHAYNNTATNDHIGQNKSNFVANFDDKKIGKIIEDKFSVVNLHGLIDSIAIHKQQTEKLKSFGFFKTTFSFFFKDVQQVKDNIKAIENKYTEIPPKNFRELATSNQSSKLLLRMVENNVIDLNSDDERMFRMSDNGTHAEHYLETFSHMKEQDENIIRQKQLAEEERQEQNSLAWDVINSITTEPAPINDDVFNEKSNSNVEKIKEGNQKQSEKVSDIYNELGK